MKKRFKVLSTTVMIVLSIIVSITSGLNSQESVQAASYQYKDFQLYDLNVFTGSKTYYAMHYIYYPTKKKLFADDIIVMNKGWNYTRYKHYWIWY